MTDADCGSPRKERRKKKASVIWDILDFFDVKRYIFFKKSRYKQNEQENAEQKKRQDRKTMKKAKEDWIGAQCM